MSGSLLHYDVHGDRGPYALMVHGMLSSRAHWLANLGALTRYSRPVVVELLGHGRSPSPDDAASYTPERYVQAFEAIREELDAERWLIVGQSLGAALTLRYVLDRPEQAIAHVFTNSMSALADDAWRQRIEPLMQAQAAQMERLGHAAIDNHPVHPKRAKRLPPMVRDALIADCALHNPHGIAMTGLYTVPSSSSRARVRENTVPSLLVVGARERRFAENAHFAAENMPHLRVVTFDAGHAVNAEAAAEFDAAVEAFFRPHPSEGAA